MSNEQAARARKQLERRLAPIRHLQLAPPPRGWIKAIRESLGMSARQLATRMGIGTSRIDVIEKAEVSGATTLRTLRQAATAMNCAFVYAFVPIESLDDILRNRATIKARQEISRLNHTMLLENQSLIKADLDDQQQKTIDRILSRSLRGLWNDERVNNA